MPRRRLLDSSPLRLPPYPYFLNALRTLVEASDRASETGKPIWEFAVHWKNLHDQGIPSSALSWLMGKGIIGHAIKGNGQKLRFCKTDLHDIQDSNCFVIAPDVVGHVRRKLLEGNSTPSRNHEDHRAVLFGLPCWQRDDGELWYEYDLVKIIPEKASNQRKVLDWCQENQWRQPFENCFRVHADKGECDPEALHNALARLNSNQINRRLYFYRDGSGKRFRFEIIPPRTKTLPIRKRSGH